MVKAAGQRVLGAGKVARAKRRKTRQRKLARHAKRREDAQLSGAEPTVPVGAARGNERVSPVAQDDQPLPRLIARAIGQGWATPDDIKPVLVQELIEIITDKGEDAPGAPIKVMAFNALSKADQQQYERDNPEAAGKAKGSVNVSQTVAVGYVDPYAAWREAEKQAAIDGVEARLMEEAANVGGGSEGSEREVLHVSDNDQVEQGDGG